jgi:hypothetical protein
MIIAVAGRRIDALDAATPRFPLDNVPLVEQRLAALFAEVAATMLIASAACGADLVALGVAGARRMRRHVVLPFARDVFRSTSVTDRPGNWGPQYDQVLDALEREREVTILTGQGQDAAGYLAANQAILRHALATSRESGSAAMAALVWEGSSRGDDDMTATFGEDARKAGLPVVSVPTR